MTLSITTLSIIVNTLSIMQLDTECSAFMHNVFHAKCVNKPFMINVVMLNVVMLNVIMLNFVARQRHKKAKPDNYLNGTVTNYKYLVYHKRTVAYFY